MDAEGGPTAMTIPEQSPPGISKVCNSLSDR